MFVEHSCDQPLPNSHPVFGVRHESTTCIVQQNDPACLAPDLKHKYQLEPEQTGFESGWIFMITD